MPSKRMILLRLVNARARRVRVQHGFGAGVAQAHLFDARHGGDDLLRRGAPRRAVGSANTVPRFWMKSTTACGHARRAMAEDHRPEAEQIVDVFVAVDVAQTRALPALDEQRIRCPARPGRARGAVDAAGNQPAGRLEQVGAARRVETGDQTGFRKVLRCVNAQGCDSNNGGAATRGARDREWCEESTRGERAGHGSRSRLRRPVSPAPATLRGRARRARRPAGSAAARAHRRSR